MERAAGKIQISVTELIQSIKMLCDRHADILNVIEDPYSLIENLLDLNNLVEMHEVKHAITEQIQLLIVLAYKASKSGKHGRRFDGHRLHTVFYGPPGVGKSRTAMCLAKIWQSLGVFSDLATDTEAKSGSEFKFVTKHDIKNITDISDKINGARSILIDLHKLYNIESTSIPASFAPLPSGKKTTEGLWGISHAKWNQAVVSIKDASILTIETLKRFTRLPTVISGGGSSSVTTPLLTPGSTPGSGGLLTPISVPHTPSLEVSRDKASYKSRIVVCSREDFVAPYSGQTAEKSKLFLMNNRGACIIIEEAYSLCTGEKDEYGKEALVVLNRFMEDYGDQVVIVFTGYRKELMESIFYHQPGLSRRCQSVFEIKGYTPTGLAAIFSKQLTDIGWLIAPDVNLVDFFTTNTEEFPAFGGDTERLALHCKLAYGGNAFAEVISAIKGETPYELNMTVTEDILLNAFEYYKSSRLPT